MVFDNWLTHGHRYPFLQIKNRKAFANFFSFTINWPSCISETATRWECSQTNPGIRVPTPLIISLDCLVMPCSPLWLTVFSLSLIEWTTVLSLLRRSRAREVSVAICDRLDGEVVIGNGQYY